MRYVLYLERVGDRYLYLQLTAAVGRSKSA